MDLPSEKEFSELMLTDYFDTLIEPHLGYNEAISKKEYPVDFVATPYNDKLARVIADKYGVDPGCVLIGNNPWELMESVVKAFMPSSISYVSPVSPMYFEMFENLKVNKNDVPMQENFELPMYRLIQMNADLTVIQNPLNPLGISFDYGQILNVLENLCGHLIVDEIFANFMPDTFIRDVGENRLIVIRSMTGYGLSGMYPSYLVASVEVVDKIKSVTMPYTFPARGEWMAIEALSDTRFFDGVKRLVQEERVRVIAALKNLGFSVIDSKTNFVLARHVKAMDIGHALAKDDIFVRTFPDELWLTEYVRIPVRGRDKNDELLSHIGRALRSLEPAKSNTD